MTRRTPTGRRAALHGVCAATLALMTAPAAGPAKAAELDGELIALPGRGKAALPGTTGSPANASNHD